MSEPRESKKRVLTRRWQVGLVVLSLLLVYTVSGFFLLPRLLKTQAEKRLPEFLQRQVKIAKIQFNPFTLQIKIDDFVVSGQSDQGVFLKIDSLLLDTAGFLSLRKRALVLERIDIHGPYLKVVKNRDLSYNFSDILTAASVKPEAGDGEGSVGGVDSFHFSLNNITIAGGLLEFDDLAQNTVHKIADIAIGLPWISNLPHLVEADIEPSFSASVNGTPLLIKGNSKPFNRSLETHFAINIDSLDLPHYLSYLPGERNFNLVSGSLATDLDLVYLQLEAGDPRLTLEGTVTVHDFLVKGQGDEKDYRFLSFPELEITLGSGNLLNGEIFLDEIVCSQPEIDFLHKPNGVYYLPRLIAKASADGETQPASSGVGQFENEAEFGPKITFKLGAMHLERGIVNVYDKRVTPAFTTRFSPVDFTLENVSTITGSRAQYSLNFKSGLGESFTSSGDFSLEPLEVKTHFDLQGVPLPNYAAYYRDYFAGQFARAELGLIADVSVSKNSVGEIQMLIQGLKCELNDCKLSTPDGELVLDLPRFVLDQTLIDLDKHECVIGSMVSEAGCLNVVRRANGELNLADLLPEIEDEEQLEKSSVVVSASEQTANKPWQIMLAKGGLHGLAVVFKDLLPPGGVVVEAEQIDLALDHIGTAKGKTGSIDLQLSFARSGRLAVTGSVGVNPPVAELDVELQKLDLPVFQSYFDEFLDLVLQSGEVTAKGHLLFLAGAESGGQFEFAGDLSIDNLETVDIESRDDLLNLRQLKLEKIAYQSQPPSFSLQKAQFEGLQVNVVRGGDGRINLKKVLVENETAKTPSSKGHAQKKPELALELKELTLADSLLSFRDHSLSPSVEIVLGDLAGSVTGLTSLGEKPAEVKFSGKLNDHAPVSIEGSIDPLVEDVFVDLQIKGDGVGLTSLSSYSGKYVGYAISKGKVSLDLNYKVKDKKLAAQNVMFIDQFDFGSSVDSPDAMSLPVKMAVSLLRNRQGEINLNLPVRGDLNDPEFSIAGIIVKVFINLITKAVTSPFALLSSLAGGGDDLNLISFVPGRSDLDEKAQQRLQKLAGVLYDRPGLQVEISGRANLEDDRQALQDEHFLNLLQLQKAKDGAGKNRDHSIVDIVIGEAEFEKYLWRA
ncbi:DUF748 domain-containing protein, partial [bacterium]|nr:DUF748 domain-containing protein [bacterium]